MRRTRHESRARAKPLRTLVALGGRRVARVFARRVCAEYFRRQDSRRKDCTSDAKQEKPWYRSGKSVVVRCVGSAQCFGAVAVVVLVGTANPHARGGDGIVSSNRCAGAGAGS